MMVVTPRRRCRALISWRSLSRTRVEGRQRLVEQQQAGRGRKRTGQRHALLLAARQLGGIFAHRIGQPDEVQQLLNPEGDVGPRHAPVRQPIADIVADREVGEERIGLEDDAEVALGRRQRRHVPALLVDRPGGLRIKARDRAQQRRLAAARRPEETDELALLDVERDVAQRCEGAVAFGEVADLEIGHSCHPEAEGRGIFPVKDPSLRSG